MNHELGTSWSAPWVLLIKPWRLGPVALRTHPWSAAIIGGVSYGLPVGGFCWLVGVAVNEPWGYWRSIAEEMMSEIGCFALPTLFIGFCVVGVTKAGQKIGAGAAVTRCFLLSGLFLLPWGLLWLAAMGLVTLNSDVMNDDSWDWLADAAAMRWAGSCLWVPAFLFVWMLILGQGFVRVDRLLKQLGRHCGGCGYNLTGTRAAGIVRCPECGAAVEGSGSEADSVETNGPGNARPNE